MNFPAPRSPQDSLPNDSQPFFDLPTPVDLPSPRLEVRQVHMQYASVQALQNVSLTLYPGEVLAIVGENGAGKSTLLKILAGAQVPSQGEIRFADQPVEFQCVADAQRCGITLIHQELKLAGNLDVAANLCLGREPNRWGWIDRKTQNRRAKAALDQVRLAISPQELVGNLPIGKQQLVEIAKALSTQAQVLIMDEPTSSLSQQETDHLMQVVKELRTQGVSIIYVSHRLSEVEILANRVLVLRDGQAIETLDRTQLSRERMIRSMVGRDLSQFYQRVAHHPGKTVLHVEGLRTAAYPQHALNFSLQAGEIVGVAGLVGAGRSELLTTLFGITPALGGTLTRGPLLHPPQRPREAIDAGMMLVPEDRRHTGLLQTMSVAHNLSLASLARDHRYGFLNFPAEHRLSQAMTELMGIRAASSQQLVQYLSGGNQQKVALGKWLAMHPQVLLLDEPTRGIDVGAKHEIYQHMHQLAGQGVGILFVSSDMEEILSLSDHALVLHEGHLAGRLEQDELTEQAIMQLATGNWRNGEMAIGNRQQDEIASPPHYSA